MKSQEPNAGAKGGPGKDLERVMMAKAAKRFDRREMVRPSTSIPMKPSLHNEGRRGSTKLEQSDDLLHDLDDIQSGTSGYPHGYQEHNNNNLSQLMHNNNTLS